MIKKTIKDIAPKNQCVLVRADLNVPLKDGEVQDDTRIRAALPTIRHLVEEGAKVVLSSHLGRPGGEVDEALRLDPVAKRLEELLDTEVRKLDDCVGRQVEDAVAEMKGGEIILLENTRFHPGEKENNAKFAKQLAKIADFFVNDAFATAHRAHASTVGVANHLPSVAGLLMVREIEALQSVRDNPQQPFVAVFGGAKVAGKIRTIESLLDSLDMILVGGAFVATVMAAGGSEVGDSRVNKDDLDAAKRIIEQATYKLVMPVDLVVARAQEADADRDVVDRDSVRAGWQILDIGPRTIALFREKFAGAKTVVWNGPLGLFEIEPFREGTFAVAREVAELDATTIIGGGDTVSAITEAGAADKITHVSTGGGAFLAFLAGEELPGIAALEDANGKAKA